MRKCKDTKPLNIVAHETGRRFLSLPLGILVLISATQAFAGDSVQLNLSATIEESCSLDRTDGFPNAGDSIANRESVALAANGTTSIGLTIDCNTPFKYSLASGNGALVYSGTESVGANSDSILTAVPYTTTFTSAIEDESSGATSMSQTCPSGNLDGALPSCNGSPFADSGDAIAIDEAASLSIALDGTYSNGLLDGVPLLAGTFQDTLTLTVTVQP